MSATCLDFENLYSFLPPKLTMTSENFVFICLPKAGFLCEETKGEAGVQLTLSCNTGLKKLGLPKAGFKADWVNVDGVQGMTLVLGVFKRRKISAGELTAAVRVWEAVSEGVAGFGLAVEEGESLVIMVLVRESW